MTIYYNTTSDINIFKTEADVNINGVDDLKKIITQNHTLVKYKDGYRKKSNFEYCDTLYGDIDNSHSEDENDWMTIKKFKVLFFEYEFYIVTSKSHQNEKDGKKPRDKYHVFFPVKPFQNADELELWLKKLTTKHTFFDKQVKDAGRFFFGSPNAKVYYNKGKSIKQDLYDVEVFTKQSELLPVKEITSGNRDDQMYRYACSLRNGGSTDEEARAFLYNLNNQMDEPLPEEQVEKCLKSAFRYDGPDEAKTLPKNYVIKNYYAKEYQTTSKSGATTTYTKEEPYIEFTADMEQPKDLFCTFVDGSGKKFLLLKDDPETFINTSTDYFVSLYNNGFTLDFKSTTNITEQKYMTWMRDTANKIQRFSLLKETKNDKSTVYLNEDVEPEDNGWFRKLLDLITVDSEVDRYRLGAGIISAFMDKSLDGKKPLFSVIASSSTSGKSAAVRSLIDIVQGESTLEFEGENDEQQIGGVQSLANKYVLYDNLQYTTRKQMLNITRRITDSDIPAWFMNISHSRVRNNKTFFATFNDNNAFNDDILKRIVTIKMKDGRDTTAEEKTEITKKLNVIEKNRTKVLADILYHIQNVDSYDTDYTVKHHIKMGYWSEVISKYLSTFFPEIDEFDFALSDEDESLSTESMLAKEFIEDIMGDKDYRFIMNDEFIRLYREYFNNASATKTSATKHMKNIDKSLDGYTLSAGKLKWINGNAFRGLEISKDL